MVLNSIPPHCLTDNTKVQHPSGIVYRSLDFEAMISLNNQSEKQGTEFVMSHKKYTENLGKQKRNILPVLFTSIICSCR
jgi:hypothetical protein